MFGQPAQSTSLFGTSTPAPTSSLFGAAPAPSTSLFGQPQPQTTSTPSLFGSVPAPASTGGGLFGSAPAAAASKPAFSFGTPAPAPTTGGGGFFGTAAPAPTPTAGGGGLFGSGLGGAGKSLFGAPQTTQTPSATASTSTAQPAGAAGGPISKKSKVNELPDGARTLIENIDAAIRGQVAVCEELKARDLGAEITQTQELYALYLAESTTVLNDLSDDLRLVTERKARLETDLADLAKATTLIEGFKAPQSAKGAQAKSVANFPFEYFARKTEEFQERLKRYSSTMDQVQQQVESSHGLSRNPAAIVPTLRSQHASFMALASAVATLDHELRLLKDDYRSIWKAATGSVQDPFRNAGVGVGGVERGVMGMEI